ncbi:hypothetical protein BGZ83_004613 [Gryganskiella cystojenkinii]|nr:hypothetical protein BGZ83_004613 [Gryganskiella cystojenkinii]
MRPASPGSFDNGGRDTNTNSLSSTHRLSKNSSHGTDPTYNITQTDMTLDALAQRWQAYQAMMKKSYLEDPFYKRWTKSKWLLLFSNTLLLIYSCAVLAVSIGYMSHRFDYATVMMEFHSNLILLAFAGSVFGITCAILGFLGVFRENRTLLTIYTTLLWVVFALYVSVGYIAFRRYKNHLNQHLRDEWMHSYSRDQRLLVQRQMKCCGWLSASSNGEYDLRCFPMINLPGCQFKYREYERALLSTSWTVAFSIVPFQLFVMIVALLCSNHVDGMLRSGRPGLKSFKEEKQE